MGWRNEPFMTFKHVKRSFCNPVEMAHRDTENIICVHIDACVTFRSGIITQLDPVNLKNPKVEQNYEVLAVLASQFMATLHFWTTFENETIFIYETIKQLRYIVLWEQWIRTFTDHKFLLFTFHPHLLEPSIARHKMMKVERWALFLSTFNMSSNT